MIHKKIINVLCVCLFILGVAGISGCASEEKKDVAEETKAEETKADETKAEETKAENTKAKDDDDIIVAGSVDTSTMFSFSVEEALVGLSYNDEAIVVLVGTFTNNSNEIISFSWALGATAMQNGYTLPTAYISGSHNYNNNEIAPGCTIPILLGWKIADAENDITLTVIDRQHYAKVEIYSQTFTIDELIQNTENYQDSDDAIEQPL